MVINTPESANVHEATSWLVFIHNPKDGKVKGDIGQSPNELMEFRAASKGNRGDHHFSTIRTRKSPSLLHL